MSAEKPTPERIVVDFPKTEIADEKTRRSVLRLALPLVLLPHVAQEFWLHSLLQRRQYGGRPPLGDHRLPSLLDSLVAHHSKRRGTAVTRPSAPRSTSASVKGDEIGWPCPFLFLSFVYGNKAQPSQNFVGWLFPASSLSPLSCAGSSAQPCNRPRATKRGPDWERQSR